MRILQSSQQLPISLKKAWDFFSTPSNLTKITPPSLNFHIVSSVPSHIYDGLTIEYRVSPLFGIPLKWVSLISKVQELHQFTDEQVVGPYKSWKHTHLFHEIPGGVRMEDIIEYEVSTDKFLPWIGDVIVENQLKAIFDYRSQTLQKVFPNTP